MRYRSAAVETILTVAWVVLSLSGGPALVQTRPSGAQPPAAASWPRTPWGDPDLQGTWWAEPLTPLERPDSVAGREFLTDKEVSELNEAERQAAQAAGNAGHRAGVRNPSSPIAGNEYPALFLDNGFPRKATNRTSLIVGPEGRIPYTQGALRTQKEAAARWGVGPFYTYLDPDTGERCLTDGLPGNMWTGNTGGALNQITQSPGYVMILTETYRDRRIIPVGAVPRGNVRSWFGEPRGRWEGTTLVVETANFLDTTDTRRYWWAQTWRRSTATLRLVERFTPIDPATISYRVTIEDPATFTRPWTVEVPLTKVDAPVYEYACHEGNYGLPNQLSGTRAQTKAGAR